ncbi:MAG TPA: DUF433 domain-containing protein [Candidatus Binataceae bacterium]|nr:DUF433 domain-containing protein [Candidatus Binataceae bacterium]
MSTGSENGSDFRLYKGGDPRYLPAYPVELAAHLLLLPKSTLKAWVFGATWKPKGMPLRFFEPVIDPPDRSEQMLSFVNLVEAHVLKAVRRKHLVHMIKVRDAIEHLKDEFATQHPLADVDLLAGGKDLFLQEHGQLLNLTMGKQIAMEFLTVYLNRIDRDLGRAVKLYPFVVQPLRIGNEVIDQDSRVIAIDPYVSYGRPVINGTGIPTDEIAERFWGGDSIDELVEAFGRTKTEIEFALRYEKAQVSQTAA